MIPSMKTKTSEYCPIVDAEAVKQHAELLQAVKQRFPDHPWRFSVYSNKEQRDQVFLGSVLGTFPVVDQEFMRDIQALASEHSAKVELIPGGYVIVVKFYPQGFTPPEEEIEEEQPENEPDQTEVA